MLTVDGDAIILFGGIDTVGRDRLVRSECITGGDRAVTGASRIGCDTGRNRADITVAQRQDGNDMCVVISTSPNVSAPEGSSVSPVEVCVPRPAAQAPGLHLPP